MSPKFLCTWFEDGFQMQAALTDAPSDYLKRRQGRASVLIPATADGPATRFENVSLLAFLVPRDACALLAVLINDLGFDIAQRTFISYGHASVVLALLDEAAWSGIEESIRPFLRGMEAWQLASGDEPTVQPLWIERPPDEVNEDYLTDISYSGVSFEAAAQVRQFNSNLAVLSRTVRHYAPEQWPLMVNLHQHVGEIVDELRVASASGDATSARRVVTYESVLVETNAVVTLYSSQLGSGTLPLGRSRFPVGEYSLLGIGLPLKVAWTFYHHLSVVFARNNHPGRLATNLPVMGAFRWDGAASSRRDFSEWRAPREILAAIPAVADTVPRLHVPHFSSRWGFHESLHAISLSWQCIAASSSKEWTLTHSDPRVPARAG